MRDVNPGGKQAVFYEETVQVEISSRQDQKTASPRQCLYTERPRCPHRLRRRVVASVSGVALNACKYGTEVVGIDKTSAAGRKRRED